MAHKYSTPLKLPSASVPSVAEPKTFADLDVGDPGPGCWLLVDGKTGEQFDLSDRGQANELCARLNGGKRVEELERPLPGEQLRLQWKDTIGP